MRKIKIKLLADGISMKQTNIIITYVYPPIPDRNFDYRAGYDGHEEDGKDGFGATPEMALADLLENYKN